MSGFLSPKYLKWRGLNQPGDIDHDHPCRGCGYNLRGLKFGGRCPECGLLIERTPRGARIDVIVPNDPRERNRMYYGLLASTVGLFLLVAMRLWLITPLPRPALEVVDGIALLGSFIWVTGVWLITPPKLDGYGRAMPPARRAARWLALAWPVAHLAQLGIAGNWSPGVWFVSRLLGGVGVLVLLLVLVLPSEDAGCDDEAKRLVTAFWGLLIFGSIAALIPPGIAPANEGWVIYGFISVLVAVWLLFALLAVYCLFSLMRTTRHASKELLSRGTRSERIREKRAEIDQEVATRIRKLGD